jgi:hypothetical protein
MVDWADWDPAFRNANRWHDRLAATLRVKDRADRLKQHEAFSRDLREMKMNATKPNIFAKEGAAKAIGKSMGDILVSLMMPATSKVEDAADRTEQIQRNLHIAFALAAHKADHGRYPPKLDDLAPKYLASVPNDLFSGKALIYRPSDESYLLYSVGINGNDDGGRTHGDDPPGDDLRVRMPLPEPKRK